MGIVTRVRRAHRLAVSLVAGRLGLGPDPRQHHHPFGVRRGASLRDNRPRGHRPLRHHDPAQRRLLVRWQGWIGGLFS